MTMPIRHLPALAGAVLALCASVVQAQVGRTQLALADTTVTLLYPTAAAARPLRFGPFVIEAAPDAEPLPGRRALVLMAHGSGGSDLPDFAQAAAMVREGLVVAQVLRTGDNHLDRSQSGPAAFAAGPVQMSRVLDALAAHPQWRDRLATDRVGVHGMSAGGAVALSMAGARWRLLDLIRHCNAHEDEDRNFCLGGAQTEEARAQRRASYRRAKWVPEFFLPASVTDLHAAADPRVAVVTLAVPVAAIFAPERLAEVAVPVGVLEATGDRVLRPEHHAQRVLRHVPHAVSLARLDGAGHFDVLSPWPEAAAAPVAAAWGDQPLRTMDGAQRAATYAELARFQRRHLHQKGSPP